jgi:hypothetical protein
MFMFNCFADEKRRTLLKWNARIAIIQGIAQGLLSPFVACTFSAKGHTQGPKSR